MQDPNDIETEEGSSRTGAPHRTPWLLPVIIVSQFAGGSVWFSTNAVIDELLNSWRLSGQFTGMTTSAVQLGFIAGTLFFSLLGLTDKYSPRKLFFSCCMLAGTTNSLVLLLPQEIYWLLLLRFVTGFFLAGIYPVGMKIASGWYHKELGNALGFLVGALVLGTAFPHCIKAVGAQLPWETVFLTTSAIAVCGGFLMLLWVPDGPYLRVNKGFKLGRIGNLLGSKDVRAAAFGYFGHMWELYTLWALLPLFISAYVSHNAVSNLNIPLWTFIIIASGSIGCGLGGMVALKLGSSKVALSQLAVSGCCCLLSPLSFSLPTPLFLCFMLLWGITVAGDSPQYSTVVAQKSRPELVGSTLTFVNCIGFFLTIVSIQFTEFFLQIVPPEQIFLLLLPGPVFGLYFMRWLVKTG